MNSSWYGKKAYTLGMKGITGYNCTLFEIRDFDFTKKDIFDISDFPYENEKVFTDSLDDFYWGRIYHKSTNPKPIKKISIIKSIQEVFVRGG